MFFVNHLSYFWPHFDDSASGSFLFSLLAFFNQGFFVHARAEHFVAGPATAIMPSCTVGADKENQQRHNGDSCYVTFSRACS